MNNHERFAQVAHDKWANEQIAPFSERIAHSLFRSQKTSNLLFKNCEFFVWKWVIRSFPLFEWAMLANRSGCSPKKWATMSDSLRSLTKNEQMSIKLVFWVNRWFFIFSQKNEQFTQKTDERIANSELKMPVICRIEFDLNWFKIYFFFARNINANKPCKCVSKTWQKIT